MNTCGEIRESIGAWLDGELSGARADAVRLHLETCLICGEERRQLENLNRVMKDVFVHHLISAPCNQYSRAVVCLGGARGYRVANRGAVPWVYLARLGRVGPPQ